MKYTHHSVIRNGFPFYNTIVILQKKILACKKTNITISLRLKSPMTGKIPHGIYMKSYKSFERIHFKGPMACYFMDAYI